MGPDRIYGKLPEITIFRYRDSAPLPVRMRNGRYISYFTHQLDYGTGPGDPGSRGPALPDPETFPYEWLGVRQYISMSCVSCL